MLHLFGLPLSQPTRAIAWALMLKSVPFEFTLIAPGKIASASQVKQLLEFNPAATIPVAIDDGFVLWESHAIMTYLADKHEWEDLYPSAPKARAIVDQYLHFHHANIRAGCFASMMPHFRKDLQQNTPVEVQNWQKRLMVEAIGIVNNSFLKTQPYLTGDSVTLADITCYVELAQMSSNYGNIFDFQPYPNVNKWLERMRQVPFESEAHRANAIVGDLNSPVEMEVIIRSNKDASKVWKKVSASSG